MNNAEAVNAVDALEKEIAAVDRRFLAGELNSFGKDEELVLQRFQVCLILLCLFDMLCFCTYVQNSLFFFVAWFFSFVFTFLFSHFVFTFFHICLTCVFSGIAKTSG
jgi:hypothetical protein